MESIETQQIQGRFKNVCFFCQTVESRAIIYVAILKKYSFLENFLSFLVKLNENFSQTLFKILFSELSGFESIKFQLQNKFQPPIEIVSSHRLISFQLKKYPKEILPQL